MDTAAGCNYFDKIKKLLQRAKNLRLLIERQRAEVCISHMDGANWVNVLSRSNAKKILVVHGTILHDQQMSKYMNLIRRKWIIPQLYNKADVVVAVSEGIKHELTEYCKLSNVIAIPNGFDINGIQSKSELLLSEDWQSVFARDEILITSGRMHDQKKQRYLLPIFKRLKKKRPNIKLVIMGDGELRSSILEEVNQLGFEYYSCWDSSPIHSNYDVYFTGYVENPFQFLKRSTLFLFPSAWEGFPLALCEAMIAGVPVLSADCPTGPREIISPNTFDAQYSLSEAEVTPNGCLLPMVDKSSFAEIWYETILQLLNDEEIRKEMIENGKKRMLVFNQPQIEELWKDLIDKIKV